MSDGLDETVINWVLIVGNGSDPRYQDFLEKVSEWIKDYSADKYLLNLEKNYGEYTGRDVWHKAWVMSREGKKVIPVNLVDDPHYEFGDSKSVFGGPLVITKDTQGNLRALAGYYSQRTRNPFGWEHLTQALRKKDLDYKRLFKASFSIN